MRRARWVIPCLSLLAACGPEARLEDVGGGGDEDQRRADNRHDPLFQASGEAFQVPPAVLKAFSFAQTRYEHVVGSQEFDGVAARFGVMGLTSEQLERAAGLLGVRAEQVRDEVAENIRGAAALLDEAARAGSFDRQVLSGWAPFVAELSAIDSELHRRLFVRDEVYGALRQGLGALASGLEREVSELALGDEYQTLEQGLAASPDFPGGVWRPSGNYNVRAVPPSMVIIHTCEGGYSGCVATLVNPNVQASAHYVVNADGSEVSQLVREAHRAWHIGASYNCSLNAQVGCGLNGRGANDFTIGIEHAGYASQTTFPAGQLDKSARLLCDISKSHKIPRDRYHVVGHGQLQPYDRTDPGRNWPWTDYLRRANAHCGVVPPPSCTVQGAILTKYKALGGAAGLLKNCTTNELVAPDKVGRYNDFQGGSIYWHSRVGAFSINGAIRTKWRALGSVNSGLKYPKTDERPTKIAPGRFNHFEGGSIFWHPSVGAFAVQGGIHAKWAALKYELGPLGYPRTDMRPTADTKGRFNHFQKGSIFWHPSVGAFAVHGPLHAKWAALKYEVGPLGYPTTDPLVATDKVGRLGHFQKGSIFHHPTHGTFALHGPLHARYVQLGAERSCLGYPTSDVTVVAGVTQAKFERGVLALEAAGAVAPFTCPGAVPAPVPEAAEVPETPPDTVLPDIALPDAAPNSLPPGEPEALEPGEGTQLVGTHSSGCSTGAGAPLLVATGFGLLSLLGRRRRPCISAR